MAFILSWHAVSQVNVAVALAWWVVAHVFQPDHPLAPAVQEHAFRVFSRRYARDMLTFDGLSKDLYQDLWLVGAVAGVCAVLYFSPLHMIDAAASTVLKVTAHSTDSLVKPHWSPTANPVP